MPGTSHPPNGKDTPEALQAARRCPMCGNPMVEDRDHVVCPICGHDAGPTIGDVLTMPVADILRGEGAKRRELGERLLERGA